MLAAKLSTVSSDYNQTGQITIIPGGPDEITTQMEVIEDRILEANETFLLTLSLTPAARDTGAYVGVRNESQITIINDDSKLDHHTVIGN